MLKPRMRCWRQRHWDLFDYWKVWRQAIYHSHPCIAFARVLTKTPRVDLCCGNKALNTAETKRVRYTTESL